MYKENKWIDYIPNMSDRPINYLEIGLNESDNLISIGNTYAKHPESKLFAINLFMNDDEFNNKTLMEFYDNSMDIIYIADNKDAKTTLENIVLSFVKLKENGYLIVDNYHNILEINMMVDTICYKDCYKFLGHKQNQFFIQKIKK